MPLRKIRTAPSGPEVEVWEGPLPPPAAPDWNTVLSVGNEAVSFDPTCGPGISFVGGRLKQKAPAGAAAPLIIGADFVAAPTHSSYTSILGGDITGLTGASIALEGANPITGLPGNLELNAGSADLTPGVPGARVGIWGGLVDGAIGGNVEVRPGGQHLTPANSGRFQVINHVGGVAFDMGEEASLSSASPGDVLALNSVKGAVWIPAGFDYVIDSRARLAALFPPVADVFTLPSGSYAIKGEIVLNAGESITTQASAILTIYGEQGNNGRIVGSHTGALFSTPSGSLYASNLRVTNTGTGIAAQCTASTWRLWACRFAGDAGIGFRISGGTCYSHAGSYFTISGTSGCVVDASSAGANLISFGDSCSEGTTAGLHIFSSSGSNVPTVNLYGASVFSTIGPGCVLQGVQARLYSIESRFESGLNSSPCILNTTSSRLILNGGRFDSYAATRGHGLEIAGAMPRLQLQGVEFTLLDKCVHYTSGAAGSALIQGCVFGTSVLGGIDWAAASVPSAGLIETNNVSTSLTAANMFQGHTAADARVMRRSNYAASAGAVSETPLVP